MKPIRALSIALVLAMAVVGCSKKDDEGKDKKGTSAKKGSGSDGPKVLKFTADAFYKDWTTTKGAALMQKYRGKTVEVTGKVFHVIQGGEYGEYTMFVTAGANKLIAKFKDKGKAANAKKVAKGGDVTINCSPSGMIGKNISLNGCVLK